MMLVFQAVVFTLLVASLLLALPLLVAIVAPLLMVACLFSVIWFVLKVIAADERKGPD